MLQSLSNKLNGLFTAGNLSVRSESGIKNTITNDSLMKITAKLYVKLLDDWAT